MSELIVKLDPESSRLVEEKVAAGTHASADDVVREALLFFEQASRTEADKLEWLRSAIREADEEGGSIPAEEVLAELAAKYFDPPTKAK